MEPAAPRRTGPALPRRRFLAGGTALGAGLAIATSGCALNDPFAGPAPTASAGSGLAPDVRIAIRALRAIDGARAVVAQVAAVPALATRTAPLLAMHDAHRAALVDAVPARARTAAAAAASGSAPTTSPTPGVTAALAQVRAAELGLHGTLTALALRAESGLFARLLGSMAASVSQHVVELGR